VLLCGRNACNDQVWQTVTIPPAYGTLKLTLWYLITTSEASTTCYDRLYIRVRTATGAVLSSPVALCNTNKTAAWMQRTADLSTTLASYKGRQVQVAIQGTTSATLPSTYYLDDLSLVASPPPPNLVSNAGFENLLAGWTTSGTPSTTTTRAHTGSYSVLLCGGNACNDQVSQSITVPTSYTKITVSYWYFITTQETAFLCNDHLYARITSTTGTVISTVQSACNTNKTTVWIQKTLDLSSALAAYKGKQVRLSFQGTTNASLPSSFFVDDVAVIAN
jgi:hypothetical protein